MISKKVYKMTFGEVTGNLASLVNPDEVTALANDVHKMLKAGNKITKATYITALLFLAATELSDTLVEEDG